MNTLVTGGNGFLGRYLVEQLLARGDRVRSLGRSAQPELKAMGVETIQGDIRSATTAGEACQGVDCVFHVAAIAGVGVKYKPFYEINVEGTQNVLAACRRHRVGRLVYTSSPSVSFAGKDQRGVNEDQAGIDLEWLRRHRCYYSLSKAIAEKLVLAENDDDFSTCALRPHLIWGPRDRHLIPRLLARAKSGRLRRVGDGDNLVDTIYVENAAAAHLLAAEALAKNPTPVAANAYFLSQGEPVNCWQWIDEILALAGLPAVEKSISYRSAWRVGAVCEAAFRLLRLDGEPPMTRFLAAQLATSHWFDISAARQDFGYQPRISTAEGMKRLEAGGF